LRLHPIQNKVDQHSVFLPSGYGLLFVDVHQQFPERIALGEERARKEVRSLPKEMQYAGFRVHADG
jgi:hypothetical protein